QHAAQRERLRSLERLVLVAGLGVEDVPAPGERIERGPALGEVVRPGERDERTEPFLLDRRARPVDAAHADAHESDTIEIDTHVPRREVIEQRSDHARPVGAYRKARRVLSLPGPVDRECREATPKELV